MLRLNSSRFLIGLVLGINLQCAISFFIVPQRFVPAYELVGIPGEAAVRGFGVLFLMWNIPYLFALIQPIKHRTSLIEAIVMQAIGVLGETFILFDIPPTYETLIASIQRFIIFDTVGFICLVSVAFLLRNQQLETSVDH